MKNKHNFRVGDTVRYNSRGTNLVSHSGIKAYGNLNARLSGMKGNNAYLQYAIGKSNRIAYAKVHVKYLDMVKPGSRHPLTTIFTER